MLDMEILTMQTIHDLVRLYVIPGTFWDAGFLPSPEEQALHFGWHSLRMQLSAGFKILSGKKNREERK